MNNKQNPIDMFFKVRGRRAGLDRAPFEAVLSRKSVLYAVDGPLGEVNLTPSPYPDVLDGEDKELFFDWLSGVYKV